MATHIARWDLDKTYLRTEFDSLRDLVKTALERPDQKRTNPGASTLLREMVRAGIRVHILSGSPEQMRQRLEDKLRLDGITWDSFTLKPNLQNLLRLRFRAVRDQLGYKLPGAAARSRARLTDSGEADAATHRDALRRRRRGRRLRLLALRRLRSPVAWARTCCSSVLRARARLRGRRRRRRWTRRGPSSTATSSSASSSTSSGRRRPDDFRAYGPRVVPFYNYLQAAFVLHEDGRLGARRRAARRRWSS